jgi:hypothetical protein
MKLINLSIAAALIASVIAATAPRQQLKHDAEFIRRLRLIAADITAAKSTLAAAEEKLVALALDAATPGEPTDPVVTPPVVTPPVVTPPASSAAPDLSGAPFAALLPPWPAYTIPVLADCEWVVEGGIAKSTLGLADVQPDGGGVIGAAYRASIKAGHALPITFGVRGNAGRVALGGLWNPDSAHSVTQRTAGGFASTSVEIVGLDDVAEVGLTTWSGEWGFTDYLGVFNIGLRGYDASLQIVSNRPCGKVVLDGCWFLNQVGREGQAQYDSAVHCANWTTLVVRRTKWRGATPGSPGQLVKEHILYPKCGGPGGLWIVENEFQGSNGTCFQVRPSAAGDEAFMSVEPTGAIVIALNRSHGYGWEHGNTEATSRGGSALSVWSSPRQPVFIYANVVTDARYGCLLLGGQGYSPIPGFEGRDRNWYNDAGFPILEAHIAGNTFENARSQRAAVMVSAVERVFWYPNKIAAGSKVEFNSEWNALSSVRGTPNGQIRIIGDPGAVEQYRTFDYVTRAMRRMTAEEIQALRAPAAPAPVLSIGG